MANILVLEDDLNLRELIGDTLEDAGHVVQLCASAAQAIEAARQELFHLILTDVRMAGEFDGVGAIEQIKTFRPNIRSIVMTGYASLDVPLRAARVQADDYLLKGDTWFGVQELLAAVRRVLEQPSQSSGWLARLSQLPGSLLAQAMRGSQEARLLDLASLRDRLQAQFYLLLRPGHLSPDAGFTAFCQLLRLESQYALTGERALPASRLDRLLADYEQLRNWLHDPGPNISQDPLLPRQRWNGLYDKIRRGQVEQGQFQQASRLWSDEQARRTSAEAYALYHWLWSDEREDGDGFVSLALGPYTLTQKIPGALQKVRFYHAEHRDRPDERFWVICLPVDEDNRALVDSDKQSTRALYWQELYGCYFTVFDKHALSLKYQLPADGLSPRAAFEILDPVFHQVGRYHKEGRYSGGFGLTDIHKLPGKPAYLHRFDQDAFRQAQHWENGRRMGGLAFCFAPEASKTEGPPDAASDQAVLGRLFLEVILGQTLHPVPPLLLHQYHLPNIDGVWRQLATTLGPAITPLRRICQAEPGDRYPSWAEAYLALRQSLASI